jgi:nitrate reductase gamma subunit
MTAVEFLNWVRGPGLGIAFAIMLLGIVARLVELFLTGRKPDLSVARAGGLWPGLRTIVTRSLGTHGQLKSPLVFFGGYVFHIGFFVTLLLFVPHILLFKGVTGWSWGGLPNSVVDGVAVITIAALVALLVHRLVDPVRRLLANFGDYYSWAVTVAPLITGYFAVHRMVLPYTEMLAIHILSVEILMISLPFTKLIHTVTFAISRYYNGATAGRKGVNA